MVRYLGIFITGAVVALSPSSFVLAAPYSELVVFGDSLSDIGNLKQSTFLFPAAPYYQGRFSNGPVYSELLALQLGIGPLVRSGAGGTNFAVGGAQAIGGAIKSVDLQVDEFLARGPVDSDALVVLFAGANDLLGGQADVMVPVNSLLANVAELIAEGARNILVGNLPLLGLTPRFNGGTQAAAMNQLTQSFNAALAAGLDLLESNELEASIFRFDVASLITDAIDDPGAFGLQNVTNSAAPGLTATTLFYNTSNIVDQPDTYLFWDDLHPTRVAHAILAQVAFDAVTYSADFNFDGKVDERDLADWETAYNVHDGGDTDHDGDSDGLDFLEWQRQYTGATGSTFVTVPEPATVLLVITPVLACWPRRRTACLLAVPSVHAVYRAPWKPACRNIQ